MLPTKFAVQSETLSDVLNIFMDISSQSGKRKDRPENGKVENERERRSRAACTVMKKVTLLVRVPRITQVRY